MALPSLKGAPWRQHAPRPLGSHPASLAMDSTTLITTLTTSAAPVRRLRTPPCGPRPAVILNAPPAIPALPALRPLSPWSCALLADLRALRPLIHDVPGPAAGHRPWIEPMRSKQWNLKANLLLSFETPWSSKLSAPRAPRSGLSYDADAPCTLR